MIINKKSTQLQQHTKKKTHMDTNMWYIDITNTQEKRIRNEFMDIY